MKARGLLIGARYSNASTSSDVKVISQSGGGGGDPEPVPLTVSITSPLDSAEFDEGDDILVEGTVSRAGAAITVNGFTADVDGMAWSYTLADVDAGALEIEVLASEGGDNASDSVDVVVNAAPAPAITPFLGLSLANSDSANWHRNKAGHAQAPTDTFLGADGHWYEVHVSWTAEFNAVLSVRRLDSDDWTTTIGSFTQHVHDDDEHYTISVIVDGSLRTHIAGGVHAEPLRHIHLAPGNFDPTGLGPHAQFNTVGGAYLPWEAGADDEDNATYQEFLKFTDVEGPSESAGDFLFLFRDGSSGSGNHVLKYFDHDSGPDGTLFALASPLIQGVSDSAYVSRMALSQVPVSGGKRKAAIAWNWRESGTQTTAHDICVAYLLITPPTAPGADDASVEVFQDPACTIAQTVPITLANACYVDTIAQDHGLRDCPQIAFDDTGLLPTVTAWICHDPEDVHVGVNTPHDTEIHVFDWNGAAWQRRRLTNLRATDLHYPNGPQTATPTALVKRGGLLHVYTNCRETIGAIVRYRGMTRFTTSLVPAPDSELEVDETQVVVGDGPGLGVCAAHLNWTLLALSQGRHASLPVQHTLEGLDTGEQVNNNSYVYCEDLDTIQMPVRRLHQMGTLSSGQHLWSLQSDALESSGGLITLAKNLVRGAGGQFNGVQNGADSIKPQLTSGPGGIPLITGDGVGRYLPIAGWDPDPPGTTNVFIWMVIRKNVHISAGVLGGGPSNSLTIYQTGADPQVGIRNNVLTGQQDMPAGYMFLIEAWFTGTPAAGIFRVGDIGELGSLSAGNNNPSSYALLGHSTPGGYSNASLVAAGAATGRYADMPAWRLAIKTYLESAYPGFTLRTGPTS